MACVGLVSALRVAVVAALSAAASGVAAGAFGDELECGAPWTLAPSPTSADLYGVAGDAAGVSVAVGRGGTVLVARDGVGWEQVDAGTTADLLGVTVGDGRLVAVGAGGTVVTSDDGVNWTVHPTPTTGRLTGVTWDGSRFVAVGAGGGALFQGVILTSADGAAWSDRTPEGVPPLLGVTWDGQRFVAVGWIGALAISVDGLAWDVRTLGDELQGCWFMLRPSYLYSVAGSGPLLVAVGLVVGDQYPGLGVSLASSDGEAWRCAQTELPPDQFRFRTVTWAGERFVAAGLGGGIGTSVDGLAWVREESPATPTLLALAAGPHGLVAVGEGGAIVTKVCPQARTPRRRLVRRP
jgi:hypothetical protein